MVDGTESFVKLLHKYSTLRTDVQFLDDYYGGNGLTGAIVIETKHKIC